MRGKKAKGIRRMAGRIVEEKRIESRTIEARRRSTPDHRVIEGKKYAVRPSVVHLGYVRVVKALKREYKGVIK